MIIEQFVTIVLLSIIAFYGMPLLPLPRGVRIIKRREGWTVSKHMHLRGVYRWRWVAEIAARFL